MVISLSSPLHVGIYEHHRLMDSHTSYEHTSEALPKLFDTLLQTNTPKRLFFARGPGSFMSIKISYIFLKTLSIALGIPLYASDGFVFNEGRPIKAIRQLYFVKCDDVIETRILELPQEQYFSLPEILDEKNFGDTTEPLYMLPAV